MKKAADVKMVRTAKAAVVKVPPRAGGTKVDDDLK